MSNKRKIPEDYIQLAKKWGLKWLGPEVPNVKTKTWWECTLGHRWKTRYSRIQRGHSCPLCGIEKTAESRRKKPKDYHMVAAKYGFEWLGPEVPNNHTKTKWKCSFGHCWEAYYSNVSQGHGCPICAIERRANILRKNPNDYHDLAEMCEFRWLGPKVPNANTRTKWECKYGHRWECHYNGIKQGKGCPYCAGNIQKIAEDYHALAKKRGFKWLGPETPNTGTNTWWECSEGHIWKACYSSIQQGRGCPECVDIVNGYQVSKLQRQICEIVNGELNYPCDPYCIDVALIDKKIAIEYDSWFWHGSKLEDDRKRDRVLLNAGWRILHIKSNNELPMINQIESALDCLQDGGVLAEIILDDWGKGPTFEDVYSESL